MDSLNSYLVIAAILFSMGIYGIITRKNAVAILMGIELILNSAISILLHLIALMD